MWMFNQLLCWLSRVAKRGADIGKPEILLHACFFTPTSSVKRMHSCSVCTSLQLLPLRDKGSLCIFV
jgi:hypothetical protein